MSQTYRDRYGGDAVAQARALSEKSRERRERELARRAGEMPRQFASVEQTQAVERKEEPKMEVKEQPRITDPLKKLRQGNRVPVEILVYVEDVPIRLVFACNMRNSLLATHINEEHLRGYFAKALKDTFG